MSSEATLTRWSDIPPEVMNPLLTRQFITGGQTMLARVVLKKGCKVPRHAHANEQISFLTEGAMRFSIGEEGAAVEKIVRAGDILVMPPNLPHAAEALEDTVNFDIFAPPRQDWIDGDDSYMR